MLLQKNIVKKYLALLNKEQKFTLVQQDEWEDYFNQYRQACQELSEQIKATDNEIDNKVFDLYGLTPEEREIVLNA
jgi:predicted DNA binding protein